jgi:peptide/nickel transport system permease protein
MIPVLFGITLLSFVIMKAAPGDFLSQMKLNPQVSPETIELMRRQFGLDQPLYVQYLKWLWGIVHLDFGYSFTYRVPVATLITERVLNTLLLTITAALLSWIIALPLGVYTAIKRKSLFDQIVSFLSFATLSTPTFVLALLGVFFAARTGWFPTGGVMSIDYTSLGPGEKFLDKLHHLMLPAMVLGVVGLGGLLRLMRSNFLDKMGQPFIMTAKAKGLPSVAVTWKHIFPNAINPLITILGFEIAGLLGGAAFTEIIFAWPGLGRLILEAVMSQDLYLVMGSLFMGSVLLILGNLFADILLATVDPRIKLR